jgi:pimeloyl-ACP methyl ester carboxylesterase
MPVVERDEARIYYEEWGNGYPVLLLAPGGLNSAIPFWDHIQLDPIGSFADGFHVIAMDQRNAARSSGPLRPDDPWGMYAGDQLAVLDALGIEQAIVFGCCIGSSFVLKLTELAPGRVTAGVLMDPTGVVRPPIGPGWTDLGDFGPSMWLPWGEDLNAGGAGIDPRTLDAFGHGLFDPDFVFSVSRDFVRTIATPMLLLDGDDRTHPKAVSEELAAALPNVERIERWRGTAAVVDAARERVRAFLRRHAGSEAS